MTPKRFVEIWQYRYHKYINVIMSVFQWIKFCVRLKIDKLFAGQKQVIIGVLLAEHFGDIVACEPLSRELKKMYPNSIVYWIVRKPYRELLDYNPNVDVVVEEYSVLFSMLLTQLNPFDEFYNCHLSGLRRYDFLRKSLRNPLAVSLDILTNNYFNHGNILEVFAKVSGLPVLKSAPKIYIPATVEQKINEFDLPEKYIVIHCHSNFSPKDWQVYYWEKLVVDLIDNYDYKIIEIGLKSTLSVYHSTYYNLCGRLSLLETAEIIKRANFFIGIDSGPAHFANAVGTYGFLLFGKLGDFNHYMPYSGSYEAKTNAKFIIKEGQPCSELNYDEVWEGISETIQEQSLISRA